MMMTSNDVSGISFSHLKVLGGLHAVVVEAGELRIGTFEQLAKLRGGSAGGLHHDPLQLLSEPGVALARRIVAQIGEIGAERSKFVDCIGCLGEIGRARIVTAAIKEAGPELDLEIAVDDFLAGLEIFDTLDVVLNDIDKFVVEVTVK